ncbi:MAG: histidine kinase [Bacteroidales bacterium]|nr:histidine kinase [Bacteroidales bacterium]MCM1415932.1 histidine kinase [bacterium]MCM1422648.1 histidine kinase [bacterium]
MKNKFRDASLQSKISSIYIVTNLLVAVVNIILLIGINSMSRRLDTVYQDNLHLNAFSDAVDAVQDHMTDYLNAKTSDSLENYYRSEQQCRNLAADLNETVTGRAFDRMERNIRHMSEYYLEEVGRTIEAKRGRNVEKYRLHYENATVMYDSIRTYLSTLNMEQFRSNSERYSELLERFRLFEVISVAAILLVMTGNVCIIIGFVGAAISPLKKLAGSADEVAKGNFEIELLPVESQDEVGVVTGAFNSMVVSIGRYIEQLTQSMEAERALKERELLMEGHLKDARLKYLQAQINPHFLFNTLNAGAQLSMMEGADRTYDYLQKVAQFYRYNMKKSGETTTVADELEMVDSYIYILNVRFAGDIHYEKHIDESLLSVEMPGMTLQPIVENCVNHGIREMGDRGVISLSLYEREGRICISVKDNGVGMSAETIEKVLGGAYRAKDGAAGGNGVGMDNVISRLKLFTGREDVMKVTSAGEGAGTEVCLYIERKDET